MKIFEMPRRVLAVSRVDFGETVCLNLVMCLRYKLLVEGWKGHYLLTFWMISPQNNGLIAGI